MALIISKLVVSKLQAYDQFPFQLTVGESLNKLIIDYFIYHFNLKYLYITIYWTQDSIWNCSESEFF